MDQHQPAVHEAEMQELQTLLQDLMEVTEADVQNAINAFRAQREIAAYLGDEDPGALEREMMEVDDDPVEVIDLAQGEDPPEVIDLVQGENPPVVIDLVQGDEPIEVGPTQAEYLAALAKVRQRTMILMYKDRSLTKAVIANLAQEHGCAFAHATMLKKHLIEMLFACPAFDVDAFVDQRYTVNF